MAREYFEGRSRRVPDMKFTEMQQMFYKTLVEDERQRINKSSEITTTTTEGGCSYSHSTAAAEEQPAASQPAALVDPSAAHPSAYTARHGVEYHTSSFCRSYPCYTGSRTDSIVAEEPRQCSCTIVVISRWHLTT